MKIKKIIVKNLFGMFNHEIEVKTERGITIIIGENGLGKTILLEMIEAFFTSKFYYFNSVVFDELILEFSDNYIWSLKKIDNNDDIEDLYVTQVDTGGIDKRVTIKLSDYESRNLKRYAINIARHYGLRRISPTSWEDRRTGLVYNTNEVLETFGEDKKYKIITDVEIPNWFHERFDKIKVALIETQRLFIIDNPNNYPIQTVKKYSDEISNLIKANLAESTELSSKLDRTYPNRLIKNIKMKNSKITDEELNEKLNKLEEKRELLDKVGLIEIEKDSSLLQVDKPENVVKDVLMLYIKDSFEKLNIFNDIATKIELLLKIINDRFKHKTLYIRREKGFCFKSTVIKDNNGEYQEIPINKLSSGEKNELVLFYELIFKTDSNSLILIDEPEISLHISWQNKFISDLREIHKLNNVDILIATHSPDIISNNWDLKVELKGVE